MDDIKIFIKNNMLGRWFTLPTSLEEIQDGLDLEESQETFLISDFEAPFKIDENDNLDKLNFIAECYENYASHDAIDYLADLVNEGFYSDMEEVFEKIDDIIIYYHCNSMAGVAYAYIEETGSLSGLSDTLEQYFDYEKFGQSMEIEGTFYITGNNLVLQIL
ncbi:antirestriction protein ArdA [Listeria seeligeri]|uniref:antirestriction protein ArdA n=1 Tax=Listeria seeligeri TaxID=1640 RepID=UPI0016276C78|nr:antirestriction protein ArdA [Listeria seeligeri]MBC2197666.1 antirestriction protein ArdA [Listeria seeligeri]